MSTDAVGITVIPSLNVSRPRETIHDRIATCHRMWTLKNGPKRCVYLVMAKRSFPHHTVSVVSSLNLTKTQWEKKLEEE